MALIQAVAANNGVGAGTTFSITIASSGVGNCLGVLAMGDSGTTSAVTDNKSQTYSAAPSTTGNCKLWLFPNTAAGVTSITATLTVSADACILYVFEESSLVTSSPIDQSKSATVSQQNWTTGNMTTTTNTDDVIYCFAGHENTGAAFASSGSFLALSGTGITSGTATNTLSGFELFGERETVTATGAYAGTGTSASAGTYQLIVAALMQSGGGGGSSSITPTAAAVALTGNSAAVTPATSTVIAPVTARRFERAPSGILMPSRKIFLPSRVLKRAA